MSTNATKKILVTGAGGPAGIAVIRSLRGMGVSTVGVDVNPLGAGLFLANELAVVPPCTAPRYVESLLEVARNHSANGLVSTMTEELAVLAGRESEFHAAGIAVWFPPQAAVEACLDKAKFAETTESAGQPVPLTGWGSVEDALAKVPGPWILKPRFGRGSRNIVLAETDEEVLAAWPTVPDPILQHRLSGREFTIDALAFSDGTLAGAVPRFRLATTSGISTTGVTFSAPQLADLAEGLLQCLGLTGPANIQGFIDGDSVGFTEINPRFSGGLPLSLASGCDLVGQFVAAMYGEAITVGRLGFRAGTCMVRHWDEVYLSRPVDAIGTLRPITSERA
ncbi:MAG: ATP-grasp domain-containing protein [Deltaproteobacteria bacterium]|nr:ATP-grasp domain-containing protein [Deltaproteobacteria bacterium]